MRRVPVVTGSLVIAIGAVVVFGWIVGSERLTRVDPDLAGMKANTAFALIAAGLTLILLRTGAPERVRPAGRVLALLVAAFGLLIVGEYLFGSVGIDEVLSASDTATHPGRSSQHTAVALALFGFAAATTDMAAGWRLLSSGLIVALGFVVLFGTVGFIYGVDYLHSVSGTAGIAVHTLFALALLSIGLFCLRPRAGPLGLLYGDDAGARIARFLLPVAILGPLLLGMARYGAQQKGWIELDVGAAIYTLAAAIGLTGLVFLTGRRLRRFDTGMRRLAAIVASSEDAIISVDAERRVSSWNAAAARLLGYSVEEALGRPVTALVPEDLMEEFEQRMAAVEAGLSLTRWETERRRKDGSRVEISLTVSPLIDADGEIAGSAAILHDISESREAARRFQSLLQAAPDAIVIVDAEGRIVLVNEQVEQVFGYGRDELESMPVEVLVPEHARGDHREHRRAFAKAPEARSMAQGLELMGRRRDGSVFPAEISLSPLESQEGLLVIAAVRDVSGRRETEIALAESEERFRRSFEDSGVGMALIRVEEEEGGGEIGRIFESNEAFRRITGYSAERLSEISPSLLIEPSELPQLLEDVERVLTGSLPASRRETRFITANGEAVWVSITGSAVRTPGGTPSYLVVQAQDINERKHFEGQLQYLADHDPLTGLFNRRRFEEELMHEVAVARRFETGGAVLVLDLDHFKLVNDSFGHAAGDELIVAVSRLLGRRLRAADVLGRMGGDEFAVVLPRVGVEAASRVALELLDAIREETVSSGGGWGRVTASVGISLFGSRPGSGSAQELLAEADIAMYDAKEEGRDRVVVFDPSSPRHERSRERLDWVERIEAALGQDGFVLHAQPMVPLGADDGLRFELLLRMIGDGGELTLPAEFLGIAEHSDLAQRIDRWVIAKAMDLLAEQERLGRDICFEVNLSGSSIGNREIGDRITESLARTGVDPERIVFEVTETAAIVNVGRAKEFASRMHELGCGFALDDFGAGFASFYYLKHLSFDLLKIDGEFVRNLPSSRTDQLVVRSVVEIARGLGKKTVAESVGDQQTVDLLREYGVDYAQGFFLGRPRPLETICESAPGSTTLLR